MTEIEKWLKEYPTYQEYLDQKWPGRVRDNPPEDVSHLNLPELPEPEYVRHECDQAGNIETADPYWSKDQVQAYVKKILEGEFEIEYYTLWDSGWKRSSQFGYNVFPVTHRKKVHVVKKCSNS